MKILLMRHGDPDYSVDNLTPKGKIEAELLSCRLAKENISKIYCSPLGRARATAAPTAEKLSLTPEILDWMQEVPVNLSDTAEKYECPWHLMPELWLNDPCALDRNHWAELPTYSGTRMAEIADETRAGADALLASHGYFRKLDRLFAVSDCADRDKTIAMFCHQGLACLFMSMLMPISPFVLWESFFIPTSSVTTLFTEERPRGEAIVRCAQLGDTSHLYAGNHPNSNSGLFDKLWS